MNFRQLYQFERTCQTSGKNLAKLTTLQMTGQLKSDYVKKWKIQIINFCKLNNEWQQSGFHHNIAL